MQAATVVAVAGRARDGSPVALDPSERRGPASGLYVVIGPGLLWAISVLGVVLAAVSVAWQTAKGDGWEPRSAQLDRAFNVLDDLAIFNWLNASALLLAAVAAWGLSQQDHERRAGWRTTAMALLLLSLDESTGLHDPLAAHAERAAREAGSIVVLLVLLLVAAAAVPAVRFLAALPRAVGMRMAVGALLLGLGALVVDALGSNTEDPLRRLETGFVLQVTLEEGLELAGALLVVDALRRGPCSRPPEQ